MAIRIFSFFALLPFLYVIYKVVKKQEINSLDIILSFHSLYFAAIPLTADTSLITYPEVKNDIGVQLATFTCYMLFALLLLFLDITISRRKSKPNLLYLGEFTRCFAKNTNLTNLLTFGIVLLGTIYLFFAMGYSIENKISMGYMDYETKNNYLLKNQSQASILIKSGETIIRLYVSFVTCCSFIQFNAKGERIPTKWKFLSLTIILYHFLISRTYLLEFFILLSFVFYSCRREKIKNIFFIKVSIGTILIISIAFPFISSYRATKKRMIYDGGGISTSDIVVESVQSVFDRDINHEDVDNKEERSLYVYQIFARAVGDNRSYYGSLSLHSISHGIPKNLYPSKSHIGSQQIIEKDIGNGVDVADSVLLHFQLDCQALGFIMSNLFFLFLLSIYNRLLKLSNNLKIEYLPPVFFAFVFPWLDRCEFCVDNFTTGLFQNLLLIVILSFLLKAISQFRFLRNSA